MKHYPLTHLFIFTSTGLIYNKTKHGCKVELETLETVKLFDSTQKSNRQNKE